MQYKDDASRGPIAADGLHEATASDLKGRARTGVRWSSVVAATGAAVQALRLFILARFLLEPDDFGLMALALVITYVASPFADLGTQLALIHRQQASKAEISSVYWFNVGLGFLLSAVLWFGADYFAELMHDMRVAPLLKVCSLCFAVEGFGLTFLILLKRDLDFRKTSLIEISSLVVGAAVTLTLALADWGVWSLAIGTITISVVRTVLAIVCGLPRHPMEMRLQYADLRPFLSFGLFQMAQTLFVRISERFDQFILGLLSGATGVGLYSVAFNIASIPVVHAMPAFAMPAATVLSRAATQKDGDQLARGYLLAVEIMMAINAAVSFGLLVVAPLLVTVVLGPKWHDIIPIVQWLSIVAVWQALYAFSGALIIATGASRLGLVWRVALTSALAIAAYLGAWAGGAVWLAAAMAGLLTVAVIPFYFFVVRRLIGPTAIKFAVAIGAPIICAALMAITVAGAGVLMRPLMPAIAALSVEVVLGVIVYVILQALLRPSIVEEIAHIVPHEGLRGGLLGMLGHVNRLR